MSNVPPPPPPPPGGNYPPTPPPPPGGGYPPSGYGPGGYGQQPPAGPKPPNYLVWAILTTLFCCLPFGIASIVFAAQVDGKYNSGDYAGAVTASANAKKWATVSAVAAGVLAVVYVIFIVAIAAGTS